MKRYSPLPVSILIIALFAGCDLAKYPIDESAMVSVDDRLTGTWMLDDKKEKNAFYILTKKDAYHYRLLAKDTKKKEQIKFTAFLSTIENSTFLNLYYNEDTNKGYLFIRILDIDAAHSRVTTASVSDSTIKYLTSAGQVRQRITENLANPTYFTDTAHFYKVK